MTRPELSFLTLLRSTALIGLCLLLGHTPGVWSHPGALQIAQSDPTSGIAQIHGKVVDGQGRPLPRARIQVQGGGSTITAPDGSFVLPQIPTGPRMLHIQAHGHHAVSKVIDLTPGSNRSFFVQLRSQTPNKAHPTASPSPAQSEGNETPAPPAKGTFYVHAEPFRRGHKLFKVERISVHDYESGKEWRQHFYSEGEDASGVSLTCDEATVGGKCKIHVSWRAVHHRKDAHDDDYDDHDESTWDREFSHDGQTESFYNP